MITKELRIGNFITAVYLDKEVRVVDTIASETVGHLSLKNGDYKTHHWSCIVPIPLTEDWLTKFGFVDGEFNHGNNEKIVLDLDGDHYNVFLRQTNNDKTEEVILFYIEIEYVHKLQNLIFALTGKELEIK